MSLKSAEKTAANEYTLVFNIDGATFDEAINTVYRKQKSKIQVPGFRKGKATRSVIESRYGKGVFYEDALDEAFPAAYEAAIKEAELDVVSAPFDVDIKSIGAEGVELSVKVSVKPVIELKDYKGIEAEKEAIEVTDDEVSAELEHMREHNARIVDVDDRAAADGDITVIDFEGFTDGKAFAGGKGEDYELTLGSGQFIPGFEEQIVGHSIGESFDITVTFPEEYGEPSLAGKESVFKINLKAIKVKELPELDDDFAKDVSEDADTIDELKKSIADGILERKTKSAEGKYEDAVMSALSEKVDAEIPEAMIEKAIDSQIERFEYRISMQGLNLQQYLSYLGMEMSDFRNNYRDAAEKSVKIELALEKIVELESLEVSDEEIEAEFTSLSEEYKMEVEEIKKAIATDALKQDLIMRKAAKLVIDTSVATAAEAKEAKPAKKAAKKPAAKKSTKAAEKKEEEAAADAE